MDGVGASAGRFCYVIPRHDPEELRHVARAGNAGEDHAATLALRLPNLGRTLNENHVVFQTLTPIIEYCKSNAFAPGPNLLRVYPVLAWRPLFAWTLWVELRYNGQPSWRQQSKYAAQYADWILGMVQDHRNQRRVHEKA